MYRRNLCFLLFSALLLLLFSDVCFDVEASPSLISVPADFLTIQAAINNATDGDIIFVYDGTYYENVVVNKSVTLVGQDEAITIVDGGGVGTVIKLVADNVAITGFTIRNGGSGSYESGIFVESSYCNITGNTISSNGLTGVYLDHSYGTLLVENTVVGNAGDGVVLVSSSNNAFVDNMVTDNNVGFQLYSSSGNNFSGNTVVDNRKGGVNLWYSSANILVGNIITGNNNYGLVLDYSSNQNTVSSNTASSNNGTGVMLGSAFGTTLRNNSMVGNRYNFHIVLARPNLQDYLVDVDVSNTVNGKSIYYLINEKDLKIDSTTNPNLGYLALINCTNITVQGLNLTDNGQGLLLAFTTGSNLTHLSISNNNLGIQLCSSSGNSITDNHITSNAVDGITLDYYSVNNNVSGNMITNNSIGLRVPHSSNNNEIANNNVANNNKGVWIYSYSENNAVVNNAILDNGLGVSIARESHNTTIVNNRIMNNSLGLRIDHSSGNSIYHNNFIGNSVQMEIIASTNMWDNGYPSGGNYWSDFSGVDVYHGSYQNVTDSDGLGDVPYVIDENNQDRYPRMGSIDYFNSGTWNGVTYYVDIVSNSTVSNFIFNPEEGAFIKFNVTSQNGTVGFCRVAIPKQLLWVENGQWTVTVDHQLVIPKIIPDDNSTYLYFIYNYSAKTVVVKGTHVVPEFPSAIMLPIFFTLTMITTIVAIKQLLRKKAHAP